MSTERHINLYSARVCVKTGLFSLALENYMTYFKRVPNEQRCPQIETEFVNFLGDVVMFFNDRGSKEELIKCLLISMFWFRNNSKLPNIFGSLLVKMGELSYGLRYILLAYKIAADRCEPRIAIENNILHVIWKAMPRWHFRMLNGKLRNDSYRKAINKALNRGLKNVIDIGSGCGLLSLYTGIHPSLSSVVTFEANPTLYQKGLTLMQTYCENIRYTSYNKLSYLVTDFVEDKRDLLITEIFDVGFFGEGILKTLQHAFNVFLDEDFTVIPSSVTMYITGIECRALDKKFRLYSDIGLLYEQKVCVKRYVKEDRYDSEAFSSERYKILTETVCFLDMALNCKQEVERLMKEEWMKYFSMEVTKSGTIHCFVVWFDLNLDEEIVISTNPFHSNYEPCWEQAIFYCQHPLKVEAKTLVPLGVAVKEEKLYYELDHPPKCIYDHCYEVSKSALQFLNDKEWTDYITQLADGITDSSPKLCIVDFCEFPLAGLKAAENGHSVLCFYKEPLNVAFILYMIRRAKIKESLVTLHHYDYYPHAILNMKRLDYVVYEPVCQDGSLKVSPMDNGLLERCTWDYFFGDIILHFVVIYSPYLDYCNRVNQRNVEPFTGVVDEMNDYSGSEHPDLDNNFPHEVMTNEGTWTLNDQPFVIETLRGLKDGRMNGILTWFTLVGKTGATFCTKYSTNFAKNAFMFHERPIACHDKVHILCQYKPTGLLQMEVGDQMWFRTVYDKVITNSFFGRFFSRNFGYSDNRNELIENLFNNTN